MILKAACCLVGKIEIYIPAYGVAYVECVRSPHDAGSARTSFIMNIMYRCISIITATNRVTQDVNCNGDQNVLSY